MRGAIAKVCTVVAALAMLGAAWAHGPTLALCPYPVRWGWFFRTEGTVPSDLQPTAEWL